MLTVSSAIWDYCGFDLDWLALPIGGCAGVVELADTQDLGSCTERCEGSIPFSGTLTGLVCCEPRGGPPIGSPHASC